MTNSIHQDISPEEQRQFWMEEYKIIEELHRHYDTINMSLMAILVAGVIGIWAVVLQQATLLKPTTTFLIEWMTFTVLSMWIRHITVHRTITTMKLNRAREIERILGMKQNLIFEEGSRRLRAHFLELGMYFALTVFGFIFTAYFQIGLNNPQITTIQSIWNNITEHWTVLHIIRFFLSALPCIVALYWSARCRVQVVNVTINYVTDPGFGWLLRLAGYKGK